MEDTFIRYNLSHSVLGSLALTYAPQEWQSDEAFWERSMSYWGIFRSFSTKELTFVKDGAEMLKEIFDTYGTEAVCSFIVQYLNESYDYVTLYTGIIDFSTYKYTEGSSGTVVKVQVIDDSFINKIKNRESLDISLSKLVDIDGNAITPFTAEGKDIYIPARTDYFAATLYVRDTYLIDHAFPLQVVTKEEDSIYDVVDYTQLITKDGSFFSPVFSTDLSCDLDITGFLTYTGGTNSVTLNLRRYNSSNVIQSTHLIGIFENEVGMDYINASISTTVSVIACNDGDYVIMEIIHYGTGNLLTSEFVVNCAASYYRVITASPYTVKGYYYHEAFTRILQAITGNASPFYSTILGRPASELVSYDSAGELSEGIVTNGLLIRGFDFTDDNVKLKVSLKDLFSSLSAIMPLSLGVEEFNGTWRIRIENMRYAFNDHVFLSVEGATEITEEVANDLTFSSINVGFSKTSSNPYNHTKGRYEYNSKASYASKIATQQNEFSQLSPYRADGNGIFSALEKHKSLFATDDTEYDDNNFLIKCYGNNIEKEENYTTVEQTGNNSNNYNLDYQPARCLKRWGSFIRACLEKYTTSLLSFISSDYNSEAYSQRTDETAICYEGKDVIVSSLDEPFFENIYYSFNFVVTNDVIKGMSYVTDHIPNVYMLVRFRNNENDDYKYGWIMKFESKKSDNKGLGTMKLLKANLDYVTPLVPADVTYGYLYNWYAAIDTRNICASGWHVPTNAEFGTLNQYLDPTGTYLNNIAGAKMKEVDVLYWDTLTYNNNSAKFNARGSGKRTEDGIFYGLKKWFYMFSSDGITSTSAKIARLTVLSDYSPNTFQATSGTADFYNAFKKEGLGIRPVKDSTTLTNGQEGTYTGNDGKIYRTICIGTQEWLADNLKEIKYRDGSIIPEVTNSTAWAALTTGARCAYDNDENNV